MKRLTHSLPWMLFAAVVLLLAAAAWQIPLSGDDWGYARYLEDGFGGFCRLMDEHFRTVNGRTLVHVLDVLLLQGGGWAGRILLPLCSAAVIFLAAALAAGAAGRADFAGNGFRRALAVTSCGFLSVSPLILRETLFWITGGTNYLLPAALLLLCLWLFLRRERTRRVTVPLTVCCILTALTTEQAACGAVLVALTAVLWPLLTRRRGQTGLSGVSPRRRGLTALPALVLAAAGAATVFFAPGNAVRQGYYPEFYSLSLLGRVGQNLSVFSYTVLSDRGLLGILCLLLAGRAGRLLTAGGKRQLLRILLGGWLLAAAGLSFVPVLLGVWQGDTAGISALPLLAGLLPYAALEIADAVRTRRPGRLGILLLAAGLQLGMLLSPVSGPRTVLLSGCLLLIPLAEDALALWDRPLVFAGYGVILTLLLPLRREAGLCLGMAVLAAAGAAVWLRHRHRRSAAVCFRLAAGALLLAGGLLLCRGYWQNGMAARENEARIAAFLRAGGGDTLTLLPPRNELCRYLWPSDDSPWHELQFRLYYHLSPSQAIHFSIDN